MLAIHAWNTTLNISTVTIYDCTETIYSRQPICQITISHMRFEGEPPIFMIIIFLLSGIAIAIALPNYYSYIDIVATYYIAS